VIWRHRSNLERLLAGTEPKLGQPKQVEPKS
jgi:glycerol-3-phosphate acyltransferase PlsY